MWSIRVDLVPRVYVVSKWRSNFCRNVSKLASECGKCPNWVHHMSGMCPNCDCETRLRICFGSGFEWMTFLRTYQKLIGWRVPRHLVCPFQNTRTTPPLVPTSTKARPSPQAVAENKRNLHLLRDRVSRQAFTTGKLQQCCAHF